MKNTFGNKLKEIDFFEILNTNLKNVEKILSSFLENENLYENYINVFILGLPRSGTTLLSQVIFYNMDISCTNNLIARFWKTPLTGCMISKFLIGNYKQENYNSHFGRTIYIWEPHEFSWFWHNILNLNINFFPISYKKKYNINWKNVRNKILGINTVLESSVVHKPLELIGYWLEHFVEIFRRGIFIFIERDLLDIALSIANTRFRLYKKYNYWWSSFPFKEEYALIKDKEWYVQIAGQVYFLNRMYKQKIKYIPEKQLILTSYEELCCDPLGLLKKIEKKSKLLGGDNLKITKVPPTFKFKTNNNSHLKTYIEKGFKILEEIILNEN